MDGNEKNAPRFMRKRELARRWDCSVDTIERAIASGELRALQLGARTTRIPVSEVLRIEAQVTTNE